MENGQPKRRKCGPRVKTGCITCRIRRVKCDEGKPECQRCVSTGRKCDGYQTPQNTNVRNSQQPSTTSSVSVARRPRPMATNPWDLFDTPRDRQLFHFYCVQSAFDLSVYLNSNFWHDMILQYSHYHHVVRQAVVALGSSHLYALSMNQVVSAAAPNRDVVEQARRYDKAIRCLREYIETDAQPDPHAILICCALFFSCENARGNREAAWQHLENGLHIVSSMKGRKRDPVVKDKVKADEKLELVAFQNGSNLRAKIKPVDLNDELVYVFSRLDVQATLCRESRRPVLDLGEMSESPVGGYLAHAATFKTVTEAQRNLDFILNRLARFLSNAVLLKHDADSPAADPYQVDMDKSVLDDLCSRWESRMESFIADQKPEIRQNLQDKHAPKLSNSPEWQLAIQIQLLKLHHRCWWTLFRSHHDTTVFTMSPNPRAEEVLDICDFLAFALPVRPSAGCAMTEADIAWKMISEIGVTAPLYIAATKFTDATVRNRAITQLTALRQAGKGLYHEPFLDSLINALLQQHRQPDPNFSFKSVIQHTVKGHLMQNFCSFQLIDQLDEYNRLSMSIPTTLDPSACTPGSTLDDSGELLGWSRASPAP